MNSLHSRVQVKYFLVLKLVTLILPLQARVRSVLQTAYKVKSKVKSTNYNKLQDNGVHKCLELESNLQINEQSHLFPVVIEINKVTTEVKFNALSCNKLQEQDRLEQITQESELHSLNFYLII